MGCVSLRGPAQPPGPGAVIAVDRRQLKRPAPYRTSWVRAVSVRRDLLAAKLCALQHTSLLASTPSPSRVSRGDPAAHHLPCGTGCCGRLLNELKTAIKGAVSLRDQVQATRKVGRLAVFLLFLHDCLQNLFHALCRTLRPRDLTESCLVLREQEVDARVADLDSEVSRQEGRQHTLRDEIEAEMSALVHNVIPLSAHSLMLEIQLCWLLHCCTRSKAGS